MRFRNIALIVMAVVVSGVFHSTGHAFMDSPDDLTVEAQPTLSEIVQSLRDEIAAGETKCDSMLEKLDLAIDQIDDKLDDGVSNEEEYLTARDELVQMKYNLDCYGKSALIQAPSAFSVGGAAGDTAGIISSSSVGGAIGGSGSAAGGGSLGGLLTVGGIAGVAIGASDGSSPGFVASPSTTN